ncbi:nucleotidyltransferase [Nitrospira sp.]|nr:nucleotidyltransferase [Nitrospira sp.]
MPVGVGTLDGYEEARPKVVSQYLLDQFRVAEIRKVFVVLRQGKWDIAGYWGDGSRLGMHLAYVVVDDTKGPPDTLDRAHAFVDDHVVAFGFPDILLQPQNVFTDMLARLAAGDADVVLGLYPAHDTKAMDMIDVDRTGRVRNLQLKPKRTSLRWAWICAVWMPTFTSFLHRFLGDIRKGRGGNVLGNRRIDPQGDVPVGAVIQAAIRQRLQVEAVRFRGGRYLDVGTPMAWAQASRFVR